MTAAYIASEIVLPMIFAVLLNLLMQPALRMLERLRVLKALGVILLILVVFATVVGLGGRDISAYLLTITLMNALVGAATAVVMWPTGVGDPVLWGRSHSF